MRRKSNAKTKPLVLLLPLLSLLYPSAGSADLTQAHNDFSPLSPYSVEYQLKSSKYKLSTKATREFFLGDDNKAVLEQKASVFVAKIDQRSSFFINRENCEIVADSYKFQRTIFGKQNDYRISFDHEKQLFTEKNNDKKKTSEIKGKLYDELSYQEALRCELNNQDEIRIGQTFNYRVRTKGKNKDYNFVVSKFEELETKIGKLDSVQLSRVRAKEGKESNSQIWFSRQHDFLLIKFRQKERDDTYGLDIRSIKSKP